MPDDRRLLEDLRDKLRSSHSTIDSLQADFTRASQQLKAGPDADELQFWRRTYVRTTFSLLEGYTNLTYVLVRVIDRLHDSLKQKALDLNIPYSPIDMDTRVILEEKSYRIDRNGNVIISTDFGPLQGRMLFAIRELGRITNCEINLDVGDHRRQEFRKAVEIRNRVTHPRESVDISDDEMTSVFDGLDWYFEQAEPIFIHGLHTGARFADEVTRRINDLTGNDLAS